MDMTNGLVTLTPNCQLGESEQRVTFPNWETWETFIRSWLVLLKALAYTALVCQQLRLVQKSAQKENNTLVQKNAQKENNKYSGTEECPQRKQYTWAVPYSSNQCYTVLKADNMGTSHLLHSCTNSEYHKRYSNNYKQEIILTSGPWRWLHCWCAHAY